MFDELFGLFRGVEVVDTATSLIFGGGGGRIRLMGKEAGVAHDDPLRLDLMGA